MAAKNQHRAIYAVAEEFLQDMAPDGVNLERYYEPARPENMNDVFKALIVAAQNTQGMPNTIKFEAREAEIANILHGFDVGSVAQLGSEEVLGAFSRQFKFKMLDSGRDYWSRWSKSVVDAASFLASFEDYGDFNRFVLRFNGSAWPEGESYADYMLREALPYLLASCIRGVGFALACEFLKEIGYSQYAKPDTHMKKICRGLGLTSTDSDRDVYKALIDMADDCGETPYKVDKILWLISSGNFYLDKDGSGKPLRVKGRRKAFIEAAQEALRQQEHGSDK